MTTTKETMPDYLSQPTQIDQEISITGKWIPTKTSGFFSTSEESKEMSKEWQAIHEEAKRHPGILSTEINKGVGQDAVLVHHVFQNEGALLAYFAETASSHQQDLLSVAKPDIHLVRGVTLTAEIQDAIQSKGVEASFGAYLYGYVKDDYNAPDPAKTVQVTAKWVCKDGESLDELTYWWQRVGTDAFDLEKGLVRFEVFQVIGENALIIHETFTDSDELKFHLTKGTAARYKKEIDQIAAPANYFFRGPVSWTIRTYSKFMGLPATYTSKVSQHTADGGSMSDGKLKSKINIEMENQNITVVYQWHANEGQSNELQRIYELVEQDMQDTEPGALKVQCFFDEKNCTLVVEDIFADAAALGQHLGTTAAKHFPNLLQIARPGQFLFCGNVPEEMQQAAIGMGLDAKFAPKTNGFVRELV